MIYWTGEAESVVPAATERNTEADRPGKPLRQRHLAEDIYGLHNYIVLDSLLKRHLHLDKGFDL